MFSQELIHKAQLLLRIQVPAFRDTPLPRYAHHINTEIDRCVECISSQRLVCNDIYSIDDPSEMTIHSSQKDHLYQMFTEIDLNV